MPEAIIPTGSAGPVPNVEFRAEGPVVVFDGFAW